MAQPTYPGVYIEEFAPAPPIQPASTRVAGFVGVAARGEINEPTLLTNFTDFLSTFGRRPIHGSYLWYAVKGFFENGGNECFVVRASNGKYAQGTLGNGTKPVLTVRTLDPGKPEPAITVSVARTSRLTPDRTRLFAISAKAAGPTNPDRFLILTKDGDDDLGLAYRFQPGDVIAVGDTDRATVVQVDAAGNRLRLDRGLSTVEAGAAVGLAPLQGNDFVARIEYIDPDTGLDTNLPSGGLVPGTTLTLRAGDDAQNVTAIVDSVDNEFLFVSKPGVTPQRKRTYRVTFRDNFGKALGRDAGDDKRSVQSREFDLTVQTGPQKPKVYNFLSMDPVHPRFAPDYVSRRGSESDALIKIDAVNPPPTGGALSLLPKDGEVVTLGTGDQPGQNEELSTIFDQPSVFTDALDALKRINEINLVSVPDAVALNVQANRVAVQQAVIAHCENLGDRFGVLDALAPDQDPFRSTDTLDSVEFQRGQLTSTRGYVGLYYPWIRVLPLTSGPHVSVPPSGHVCGLMARVDGQRGVFKAPANETLNGAVEITRDMSNEDQGVLNMQNINVIRTFTQKGRPIVFGARTTSSDTNWQYVNVRRLFLFLEKSISNNLRASIFEPNNTGLWEALKRTITAFLLEQWHSGALFGAKAEQAFYVRIDEALNPFNERALGKLTIEIGVQPTYPAEFIIVRIGIWDGVTSVSE